MGNSASGRFLFVDALRGIASLGVVLFHLRIHIPLLTSALPGWAVFLLDHGELGVSVFFVLSGFVIAHSVHAERVTIPLAVRFMLRRSLRLDPPYWVSISLTLALAALSTIALADKQAPNVSVAQLAAHILYL